MNSASGQSNRHWKDFIDQNQNALPPADVRGYQLVPQTSYDQKIDTTEKTGNLSIPGVALGLIRYVF